jgi:hypothetical protein
MAQLQRPSRLVPLSRMLLTRSREVFTPSQPGRSAVEDVFGFLAGEMFMRRQGTTLGEVEIYFGVRLLTVPVTLSVQNTDASSSAIPPSAGNSSQGTIGTSGLRGA